MSQQVSARNNPHKVRPEQGEEGILESLQVLACVFGYPILIYGWFAFSLAFYFLLTDPYPDPDSRLFRTAAYFIVPGWLLLRFGAGLFPFGRKLSKPSEEWFS